MTIQKLLSAQLREPSGIAGILTGLLMDMGNREMYSLLIPELKLEQGMIILEAGFGSGRHISQIMALAPDLRYYGIDISDSMLNYSRRCNRVAVKEKRVSLIKAPIDNTPFPDDTFDAILTVNTIYFWENSREVMAELRRILKPGGRLTIGANSGEEMVRRKYREKYFNFFERDEIEHLVTESGLSLTGSFYKKLKIEDCIGVSAVKSTGSNFC